MMKVPITHQEGCLLIDTLEARHRELCHGISHADCIQSRKILNSQLRSIDRLTERLREMIEPETRINTATT